MLAVTSLVICLIGLLSSTGAVKPSFTISEGGIGDDAEFSVKTFVDQPELAATWKYYESSSYSCNQELWEVFWNVEKYQNGIVELYYGSLCLGTNPDYKIGAVRLIGEAGVRRLTLCSGFDMTENSTSYTADQPYLSEDFKSLALVGHSGIQLFTSENYGGDSYCLPPGLDIPSATLSYLLSIYEIGLPVGQQIKSFKFNCDGNATMVMPARKNPEQAAIEDSNQNGRIQIKGMRVQ